MEFVGNPDQLLLEHDGHPPRPPVRLPPPGHIAVVAAMFRALGDPERLRLLIRLAAGEACVSELAEQEREKLSTVSARLKALHAVRLVTRRREAKHIFYALADEHVWPMVRNAVDHAAEDRPATAAGHDHQTDDVP
jgi:DNA-binding transcriptional ArsR family regulator